MSPNTPKIGIGLVLMISVGKSIRLKDTVNPVLSGNSKRIPKIGFQCLLSLNAGQKHCRVLQGGHSTMISTFIKLPFFIKTIVLSNFKWSLKTGFTVSVMTMDVILCTYIISFFCYTCVCHVFITFFHFYQLCEFNVP